MVDFAEAQPLSVIKFCCVGSRDRCVLEEDMLLYIFQIKFSYFLSQLGVD